MVDAALNVAAEQVIEYSAYGALLERAGNRGPAAAPQNLYRTNEIDEFGRARLLGRDRRGDRRAVGGAARGARAAGLGDGPGARRPQRAARAPRPHRRAPRRRGVRQRTGDEIVERLWDAGVPVAKVMQPHRQTELPQLAFRGFFEEVDHPVNAPRQHSTLPMRLSRGPHRLHARPAPLLGEHNRELLSELGLTDDEIAELEADGVIGDAPAMHGSKAKT